MRTLKELAQEALDVQDASNPIAVSQTFANVVIELYKDHKRSMDEVKAHPIFRMWASKISSLAGLGTENVESFSQAYERCTEYARSEIVD